MVSVSQQLNHAFQRQIGHSRFPACGRYILPAIPLHVGLNDAELAVDLPVLIQPRQRLPLARLEPGNNISLSQRQQEHSQENMRHGAENIPPNVPDTHVHGADPYSYISPKRMAKGPTRIRPEICDEAGLKEVPHSYTHNTHLERAQAEQRGRSEAHQSIVERRRPRPAAVKRQLAVVEVTLTGGP